MNSLRFRILIAVAVLLWVGWCHWAYGAEDVLILKDGQTQPKEGVLAVTPSEEEEETASSNESFLIFYEKWRNFEAAFEEGNSYQADKALREIANLRARYAVPKITEVAMSLIQYGNLELSRKKPGEALNLFQAAAAIDPSLPYAFYSQARVYLSRGLRGIVPALKSLTRGLLAPQASLVGKIHFYTKYLLILIATFVLLGFAFGAILLIKYNRLLRHDALERYGTKRNPTVVDLVIWLLLSLPIFLFLGPLWLGPFWLAMFWRYARLLERFLAFWFLIVFALAYPCYRRVTQISLAATDPFVSSYMTAFSNGPSPASIADFEKYMADHRMDRDGSILLAYLYKTDQRIQASIEALQKHILRYPSDARAYNNLASIFFLQGETDSPLSLCQKAIDLDPNNAIYYYNVSKLHRAKFSFGEAERFLGDARRLNPSLMARLEGSPQDRLVDDIPTEEVVWSRIEEQNGRFSSLLANPFSIAAFGFLLLALLFGTFQGSKRGFARACEKCGKPFCKKCQAVARDYSFCTQCMHIFIKKDGVSPVSRKEKVREIEKHSRHETLFLRFSSLILPGSGSVYQNQTLFGMLILLFWFFFVSLLFFNWKFPQFSYFEPPESLTVLTRISLLFMVILYLIANVRQWIQSRA